MDAGCCAEDLEVDYNILAGIPFGLTSSGDRSSITCSSKESQGAVQQGADEGMVGDSGRKVFSTNSSPLGVL